MTELDRNGNVRILRPRAGDDRLDRSTVDAVHHALDQVEATE